MKRAFFLFSFGIFVTFVSKAHADVIITQGSSSNSVHVENSVSGNGTSTTHIETNVNGNDHVYDSNGPGSVTIENNGTNYSVQTDQPSSTPSAAPVVTQTPTATSSASPTIIPMTINVGDIISAVVEKIKQFLHSL